MNKRQIKNGPVAYFDVLGYQNINSCNDINKVAQIIVEHIDVIPILVHDFMKKNISPIGLNENDEEKFAKSIKCLLLSDSILLTSKQPIENFNAKKNLVNWLFFILTCLMLMNKLFDKGLLLRGAIGYGSYFQKRNCFAGKSIIDTIQLAENIDIAGCVFVPNAWKQVEKSMTAIGLEIMADFIKSLTFRYETPLKNGKIEHYVMLVIDIKNNIPEKISNAFISYNRKITKELEPKIKNTTLMIESFYKNKKNIS